MGRLNKTPGVKVKGEYEFCVKKKILRDFEFPTSCLSSDMKIAITTKVKMQ